jgi:hypothetical protein
VTTATFAASTCCFIEFALPKTYSVAYAPCMSSRKAFASSFAAPHVVARFASKLVTAQKSHVGQGCHR